MKAIPYKTINISELNEFAKNTLSDFLEMEVYDIGEDFLTMSMPVQAKVHQPMGQLHGGATAALAENVASLAGNLVVDRSKAVVGLSLHSNHLRSKKEGMVYATAKPVHIGKSTHVWEVRTVDEDCKLISISKLTLAVIDRK